MSVMQFASARAVLVAMAALVFTGTEVRSAKAATLNGTVQSGGNLFKFPLAKVPVTLYEATGGQPIKRGTATTNLIGRFTIKLINSNSNSIFFAVADLGKSVQLVAILGPQLPANVTINELTTAAASYSMAQFYKTGTISGASFPLQLAAGMNDNLVNIATGEPSAVLLTSPNADQTNSLRSTRALANLLAACTINRSLAAYFRELTRPPGGVTPSTTPQAMANLARNPQHNLLPIYLLTKVWIPYFPGLVLMPDAWTLTVKLNDSGDDANLFGGTANIAFDSKGYAWITNNVIQGQTVSSKALMVLKPNGKPSDGSNGTPVSPIVAGGILGAGFGITIDPLGSVWVGNFGWGNVNPSADGNGSVSQFTPSGQAISGDNAYQGGPVRAQATVSDADGNIWIASFGNDSVYVFKAGNPYDSVGYQFYPGSQPFGIAIAHDGTAWVTNGGGFSGEYPSSVARLRLVNGQLVLQSLVHVGKALKGVAIDSQGHAWVASQGDSKIYMFRPNGTILGSFSGGGINGPWGATVDGDDNIWVANFGPLTPFSNFTNSRVSKLAGVNPATRPPGKKTGDPISTWTGYTVPTAGSQVLLHNGQPLYGPGKPPSFSPLMRMTSTVIDRAGNLWATNNWKPDFNTDITANPGGDGIVIFVGVAPPPR
jgi:hypothetical protein